MNCIECGSELTEVKHCAKRWRVYCKACRWWRLFDALQLMAFHDAMAKRQAASVCQTPAPDSIAMDDELQ